MRKSIGSIALVFLLVFAVAVTSGPGTAGATSITFGVNSTFAKIGEGWQTWTSGMHSLASFEWPNHGSGVWAVWLGGDGNGSVYFAEGWLDGYEWGPTTEVAALSQASSYGASIAISNRTYSSAAAFHVAWEDDGDIKYSQSTNWGSSWSSPAIVNSSGSYVSVAGHKENKAYVAYNVGNDVYVSEYNGTWTHTKISDTSAGDKPSIAVDSSGYAHVAWDCGGSGICYNTNSGGSWITPGPEVAVGSGSTPSLAVSSSGTVYIAYVNSGIKCINDSTGSWSSPASVSTDGSYPSLAVRYNSSGSKDEVSIAYKGTGNKIYLQRSTNSGASFLPSAVEVFDGDYGLDPSVAVDSSLKAHVIWKSDWGTSNDPIVHSREE